MSKVLEDFLDLEPFAAEVGRHCRTVRRWIDQPGGLPCSKIGNRTLIHVPTAREWIMSRMKNKTSKSKSESKPKSKSKAR